MTLSDFRYPSALRRVVAQLVPIVCPSEVEELGLVEEIVDRSELFARTLAPGARLGLVGGLIALEGSSLIFPSSRGKRFSQLDPERARAHFERWWHGKVPLTPAVALALKAALVMGCYELPEIKGRLGYDPEDWIAKVSERRIASYSEEIREHEERLLVPDPLVEPVEDRPARAPLAEPRRICTRDDWPLDVEGGELHRRWNGLHVELSCDAVVIGTGAGGAVAAAELAEAGLDVIVLEEGGYHRTEEFTPDASAMVRKLYRDGGMSAAIGSPPVLYTEGKAVGGSTLVNGGMTWRPPERVLAHWGDEHGVDRIGPAAMEPYFQRVEKYISAAFQDPETRSPDNELLKQGAEKQGWEVIENVRNQLHCAGANNCAFGCPTRAKRSTLVSYIPRARAFGARVLADCRATRVLCEGGRARGVSGELVAPNDEQLYSFTVHAPRVVVAAGAMQTPALLLRSKIVPPSRRVGYNLTLHPNVKVVARFDDPLYSWRGVHQHYQVRQFHEEGFVMAAVNLPPALLAMSLHAYGDDLGRIMQDYDRMVVAGVLVEDTVSGRVRLGPHGRPVAFYQISEIDAQRFIRGSGLLAELMFTAGARQVLLPFEGSPPLDDIDAARALPEQKIRKGGMEVATVHIMGTTSMGEDSARHVCDSYGRVHGYEGLVVADASLFPSPVGVNPMETIMALATRNAERMIDRAS